MRYRGVMMENSMRFEYERYKGMSKHVAVLAQRNMFMK